jgi:hypothetical protein
MENTFLHKRTLILDEPISILVNLHTTLLHECSCCHERLNNDKTKRIYIKMKTSFRKFIGRRGMPDHLLDLLL